MKYSKKNNYQDVSIDSGILVLGQITSVIIKLQFSNYNYIVTIIITITYQVILINLGNYNVILTTLGQLQLQRNCDLK